MDLLGKIIPIVSGLGFLALVAGLNLFQTKYDDIGLICTILGAIVFLVGLILTFITRLLGKRGEHKIKYGRYDTK
jgi:uncharacterized membrane protein